MPVRKKQKTALTRKPITPREVVIMKRLKKVLKMPVSKIALAVDRHKKSVYKALAGELRMVKRGPKEKLSKAMVTRVICILRAMIATARGRREVTMAMIMKRAKVKVCEKVLRCALQKRGIKFRRMRTKPVLTKADRKKRRAFAEKYRRKTKTWWLQHIHLHIDLKNFPVYTNDKARGLAAMREIRGAYRAPGQGLDQNYVVLPKEMRFNPGARSCRIAAGVGNGRARLWHEVGKKWSGAAAAKLYQGPLHDALKRGWPKRRTWNVLEDNDPTGFKSTAGEKAKKCCKIVPFVIPPRSPDLSVCDYALWKQVNRVMRQQETRFRPDRKETRQQYIDRLHKAAKGLSKTFINKSIGDMVRRCKRLHDAKGGHFEEGGR